MSRRYNNPRKDGNANYSNYGLHPSTAKSTSMMAVSSASQYHQVQPARQQINYAASYPQLLSKDVVCGFCRHRFYIGKDLKGNNSPLLLPCGHATCSYCESARPERPCLLCPNHPVDVEARKRLPYNLYVIGLVHAINSAPLHIEDVDMKFHVPLNAIARHNFEQGACSECGMIANYDCKDCKVLFCKLCFKKIHGKALQHHEAVHLNKNVLDYPMTNFCPSHETEASEYYCSDCDAECCSHCILKMHNNHKTELQLDRNRNLLSEFDAAFIKLQETRLRIQQTQKIYVHPFIYNAIFNTTIIDPILRSLQSRSHLVNDISECIERLVERRDVVCLLVDAKIEMFVRSYREADGSPIMKRARPVFLCFESVFLFDHSSYLARKLERIFYRIHEAGMWKPRAIPKMYEKLTYREAKTIWHDESIFMQISIILMIGYCLSLVIFIAEKVVERYAGN